MNKKSQAAIEFLVTYGWAILGVMVVVGALAYFGVFNTDRFINDECSFGTQLYCEDFILLSTSPNSRINLTFRNNFGQEIRVDKPEFTYESQSTNTLCGYYPSAIVPSGGTVEYYCTFQNALSFPQGEKIKLKATMPFRRNIAGAPTHNVTGTIVATVQ